MTYWLAAAALWGLTALNWSRFRDWLFPAVAQSALWAVVLTWLACEKDSFDPIKSPVTWIVILVGSILFSAGAWAATLDHRPYMQRNFVVGLEGSFRPRLMILLAVACLVLPFFVRKMLAIAAGGSGLSFLADLREEVGQEGAGFGFYVIAMWVAFAAAGGAMVNRFGFANKRRWCNVLIFLSFSVAVVFSVLSSGRNSILFLLLISLGVPLVLRAIRPKTFVLSMVALVLTTFVVFAFLIHAMNLGNDDAEPSDGVAKTVYDMASLYVVGPVVAFDKVASNPPPVEFGVRIFRDINKTLNLAGENLRVRPVVEEWVTVSPRGETNIYTGNLPYFLDFGLAGVFMFQFMAGLFHGHLYRKATVKNPRASAVLWYALFLFPLAMQYCTDAYMVALNRWVIFLFLFLFLCARPLSRLLVRVRQSRLMVTGPLPS